MMWCVRGVLAGLAILAGMQLLAPGPSGEPPPAAVPETQGNVRTAYIQFNRETADIVLPAYLDLFRVCRANVLVGCPTEEDWQFFAAAIDRAGVPERERFQPVIAGRPISAWAKDRFIAVRTGNGLRLLVPHRPPPTPGGRADWLVARDLARVLRAEVRPLPLDFEAGDLWVTHGLVFVHRDLIRKNGALPTGEILRILQDELGARPIVIDGPPHHVGMFLTPLDDRTVAIGDPELARGRTAEADFSHAWLAALAALRVQLEEGGFRVVRLPFVPTADERAYATYNNVLIDGKRVFMPVYGMDELDGLAESTWRALGFEVCRIDARKLLPCRGAIHCLVNVLARD